MHQVNKQINNNFWLCLHLVETNSTYRMPDVNNEKNQIRHLQDSPKLPPRLKERKQMGEKNEV